MSHDVRLRRYTCVHCTGYGASEVYSKSLMSCPFCVWGAAECHGCGKQSLRSPKGVIPAAARTMLFLVLPVRSCREGPKHFGPTFLAFLGSRRLWCVKPRTRVSRLLSNRISGKTQAKSSLKALTFMPLSCEKFSRGINLCSKGINLRFGALIPVPPLGFTRVSGKERPKTVRATNVHHPGRRNLHERLGNETRSGETGSVPFACSLVGALSSPCALGVPMSRGSNVPELRLGVPMSRGSNVPRDGKPGCVA